jgi:shikimate 5-dehydrogenase
LETIENVSEHSFVMGNGGEAAATTDPEASNESSMTNESVSSRPPNMASASATAVAAAAAAVEKSYAPQLKFSEDGRIIINEESLLIQRENVEPVYDATVVESEQGDNLTYNSYRKHHHTKKWTDRGTFYFPVLHSGGHLTFFNDFLTLNCFR